ncbi:MAG: macro domain-containing protein [Candidatus Methylacidiphilales bacterium]|nr:macro domain-containing protein [Candidatus Methylacidiphilales bacterium]
MITLTQGNLFESRAEALVNAVNIVGVMGKGIALQFKQKYPAMFKAYAKACKAGELRMGKMHVYELSAAGEASLPGIEVESESGGRLRWIINFPTKNHFRDVEAGLTNLVETIRRLGIQSIAIPALGCGYGGLDWIKVQPVMEKMLAGIATEVDVLIYQPF